MAHDALDKYLRGLVPQNRKVVRLARRLRWTPEKAVERIKSALPGLVEQQVYLEVAADFGFLPESMAKLLRFYLGEQRLEVEDMEFHSLGNNLVSSKFATFAEFLRECLHLLKVVSQEYTSFSLTIDCAAVIVMHYGVDEPELLVEMVDNNLEELCELLGVSNRRSYSERMRICVWLVATKVIPENKADGRPDILDISDILALDSAKRYELRRLVNEEMLDYLSSDSHELGTHDSLDILKKMGII